ncbi:hypothetical protein ACFL0G_04710 [Candidatus Zixiibacteriota bacterium]
MPMGNRAPMSPEEEIKSLKGQRKYFESAIQEINKRIQELKTADQDEKK